MLHILTELTGSDARNLCSATVAVIPAGATEHHGPYLPLGTDTLIAEAISDAAMAAFTAKDTPGVLRLPALWLGASHEHGAHAGTLTAPARHVIDACTATLTSLHATGITRAIIVNAHGGNIAPLAIAALEARRDHAMLCATPHWLDFGLPADIEPPVPPAEDMHAGWLETSLMLAIAPHLVRENGAKDNDAARRHPPAPLLVPSGPIPWGWLNEDLSRTGVIGNPHGANAGDGEKILAHAAESLARLISQFAEADWPA